ncbi:SDR family NAD(P)-dependent oxidoreductase [Actinokineospora enzanensis]|uniref:SDR family NAD(P)-dependent oxidoreductase n=1 Tax=Actinokineospora enzanensis TaxID=155975 RepID=UPI000360B405|nr:SDR family oxidoreductase [Actinokineospora enzanensis]
MTLGLTGKNILITGATRGIGAGITRAFAAAGSSVVGCYRSDDAAAAALAAELADTPGEHHFVRADVADPADVQVLVKTARERLGALDVVVNNAAAISHVPFAELELAEWNRVLTAGLTSAYLVTRAALPVLADGGSVVNIGSRVAVVGVPLRSHYAAAKAGLLGLTRTLAKELGGRRIRVNTVAPGAILTEEAAALPRERLARYEAMAALGRLGDPAEVAGVVVFLASGLSTYLTGQTLTVDGGM